MGCVREHSFADSLQQEHQHQRCCYTHVFGSCGTLHYVRENLIKAALVGLEWFVGLKFYVLEQIDTVIIKHSTITDLLTAVVELITGPTSVLRFGPVQIQKLHRLVVFSSSHKFPET